MSASNPYRGFRQWRRILAFQSRLAAVELAELRRQLLREGGLPAGFQSFWVAPENTGLAPGLFEYVAIAEVDSTD